MHPHYNLAFLLWLNDNLFNSDLDQTTHRRISPTRIIRRNTDHNSRQESTLSI